MSIFSDYNIFKGAALAPMVGYTDDIFRAICAQYGATFTVSEMVSAKALALGDKKSEELCRNVSGLFPYGIQLFGSDYRDFSVAAKKIIIFAPDFIDINVGCPAPKIIGSGGGSALLLNPAAVYDIVSAVKEATGLTVTVKMRLGIDNDLLAILVAQRARAAGAELITVHGRFQKQGYRPPVYADKIKMIKQSTDISVIANGDVLDCDGASKLLFSTGADGIMIGRGALGNPFVFEQIAKNIPKATGQHRLELLCRHAKLIDERFKSNGIRAFRSHAAHYIKGFKNAAALRTQAVAISDIEDVFALLKRVEMQD